MTPYSELASALRERRSIIADREFYQRDPVGHLEKLQAVSEQIKSRGELLPPPIHPQLAHFLQRCSYDKALDLLSEGNADSPK